MQNLSNKIVELKKIFNIQPDNNSNKYVEFNNKLVSFLVANNWFGDTPSVIEGDIYLSDRCMKKLEPCLIDFISHYGISSEEKESLLFDKLEEQYPETAQIYFRYKQKLDITNNISCVLIDFLLHNLPGELRLCTDTEITTMVKEAYNTLPKLYGSSLTDFFNWILDNPKIRTAWYQMYFLDDYYTVGEKCEAYGSDFYLRLLFHLFNNEYIEENDMYVYAHSECR